MSKIIKNLKYLMKFRIATATGISSVVGYLLSTNEPGLAVLGAFFGAFFLAAGAASVNEIQEWKFDALMNRTKQRPLPQKYFTVKEAVYYAILFFIIGFSILMLVLQNYSTILLGLSAFILYNGFYTPMKRITPFATVPGAIIGVIPPILGWSIGNTNFYSPQLFSLIIFLFIWQIPHFYFLLFIYKDDYKNAGYPVLTDRYSIVQISRISFLWIVLLVLVSTMIIITDKNYNLPIFALFLLLGFVLLIRIRKMIFIENTPRFYKIAFMQLNMFVLLVLFLVSLNKFLF